MKKIIYFVLVAMVGLIVISAVLSLQENYLKIQINKTNANIKQQYGQLQSLKAEWSYLNNKQYLQFLTKKFLPDFEPITIKPSK